MAVSVCICRCWFLQRIHKLPYAYIYSRGPSDFYFLNDVSKSIFFGRTTLPLSAVIEHGFSIPKIQFSLWATHYRLIDFPNTFLSTYCISICSELIRIIYSAISILNTLRTFAYLYCFLVYKGLVLLPLLSLE